MIEDVLLDEVYTSIVLRGDYASILTCLSRIFDSHAGAVLEQTGNFLQFRAVSNLDPVIMADYNREYHSSDPWVLAEGDRPPGAVTIGSRLVSPAKIERSDFYHDILKPHDIWDILNSKFGAPPGPVVYFTFYRPHKEVFLDLHAQRFAAIGKHIARAHRLRAAIAAGTNCAPDPLERLRLTPKEYEIASLMLEGYRNAIIAEIAAVTHNTLKWHVRNIFLKAEVRSKAAFIARFAAQSARTQRK